MTQSAVLMTSRLCSITTTVLPASAKPCSTWSSFWMSSKCRPVANGAGDPDIGEEVHLQAIGTVALAGLATASGLVEAEAARLVTADLRLGQLGEQRADLVEDLDVRRWVRAWRAADRRLIDVD